MPRRRSRRWVGRGVAVLALFVGVLLGPSCGSGMAVAEPSGGHGTMSAGSSAMEQPVTHAAHAAPGAVQPSGDQPSDLGAVLVLCLTFLVGVVLVMALRPMSGFLVQRHSARAGGVRPATVARAPDLARLCVLRT